MNKQKIEEKSVLTEYYDANYAEQLIKHVAIPMDEIWFRSKFVGWENFPERNNKAIPLIIATNHSGMSFPWDAMIFGSRLNAKLKFSDDSVRPLTAPMLSASALMNPFSIDKMWNRAGGIDATFDNFELMMQKEKRNVLIYPEGVPGIGKGFNNKYQLQELKTAFLRMSIKYKTDIVFFSTVNGEYLNPYSYSSDFVNKMANKIGLPFLPLSPITLLILLFPWIFYFAFPAKLTFVLGPRIKPYKMIDKPYDEITQEEFKELSKEVTKIFQKHLHDSKEKYGKKPYQLGELFKQMFSKFGKMPVTLPFYWPIIFYEFERQYKKKGGKDIKINSGFFKNIWLMIKNPITIAFFIPILGWIPLMIRGYRGNTIKQTNTRTSTNRRGK